MVFDTDNVRLAEEYRVHVDSFGYMTLHILNTNFSLIENVPLRTN